MRQSSVLVGMLCLAAPGVCAVGGEPGGSTASPAAQALSPADRQRIENYGAIYVRALNSGATEGYTKALPEVFSEAALESVGATRLVGQMARVHESLGSLEFHHAELVESTLAGPVRYFLHVYARSQGANNWRDLQFRLEATPPHRIKELVFIADVAEPVYLPNGAITDRSTLTWLNGYVDKLIAEHDLSGSVLIARGDAVVYERVFGYADAARAAKITESTRFSLASGNKMFTAVAVAQLAERGRLGYSDPIGKYFPDFPDPAFARQATIHHLLSHTSGVGEYWTEEYEKHWGEIHDVKGMLPWVYKAGTVFEPGTEFRYSNSNFILAGLIVERVSGMDYYSYVREFITEPLGMTMTGFYPRDGSVGNLAEFLRKGAAGWEAVTLGARGTSAGGGFSTPRDMLKFGRGLAGGRLVSKETLALLTTTMTREVHADMDYGYGFELADQGNVRSYGHGGIARGVNFAFRYFPAQDLTFVICNNQDNGAYDDLRKNIVKLITGER